MLHPHIPEDLKHFGKHLLATFLGLLMALGLEQWREHHVEAKRAEQALAGVETELRENLALIQRQTSRSEVSARTAESLDAYIGGLIAAKRRGRTLPPPPDLKDLGIAPNFYMDAWETLKGLGVLHHLPPERARRISRAYLGFSGFRQNFDAQPLLRQIPASIFVMLEGPEHLAEMSLPDLERTRDGVRLMRLFFLWCRNEMDNVRTVCEAALKP